MPIYGPKLEFADAIHGEKYRGPGEDFRESQNRVAAATTDNPEHFEQVREIMLDQRFLAAGRVQASMGSTRIITPYNCFVSGTIEDSFVDGHGSIMGRAAEAAKTMRMGGGIGYDFSTLRPRGDIIRKLQSRSSGPVSFMSIFDAVCRCVASSGHRRGAQMGVLRVDHPDIEEFVHAKQNNDALTGFNVSIGVTDEFMNCLNTGRAFQLRWGGQLYREIDPVALWEMIMRSTHDWAEPGVLFIDRINQMNNLYYCERIAATNPCGEQPLPPYGACLLGSFNLTKYVTGIEGRRTFNRQAFIQDIFPIVRAMDNIVDRATYPLHEQEQEAKNKRRMGLGVTGVANTLEALGHPYGSAGYIEAQNTIMSDLMEHTYLASVKLASMKGAFKLYDETKYLNGEFVRRFPKEIRDEIKKHGIRNSHLTSIAPTGTISITADNVSSGIEPVFSYSTDRMVKSFDGDKITKVEDYGYRVFGVKGKQSKDITAQEHVDVLCAAVPYIDSAISKTCNVGEEVTWEEFKSIYTQVWERGGKGCTTYRINGKRGAVLVESSEEKIEQACYIDPETGRRECA